jgi:N-acetylmuramoyl-L-alanine amidase
LAEKLQQRELAQLLQRITVMKRLEALSPDETAGYIRHRLRVAGHSCGDLFEPSALDLIAERSQGIPRNINKICFRALLEGYTAECQTLSSDIVEKATQRLEFLTQPRPKLIAMPTSPSFLPLARSDAPAAGGASSKPLLTYQPPTNPRLPSWGLWAGALTAVLLTAGFAIPHNAVKGIARAMRQEIIPTKNLAASRQQLSDTHVHIDPKKNAHEISNVTAIHASSTGEDAQVVVMLDDAIHYESARASSPDRIYFDLHNARLPAALGAKTIPVQDGLPKWVRAAQNTDDVVRLVLDAGEAKGVSAKLLSDPYRLVIDVHSLSATAAKSNLNSDASHQNAASRLAETTPGLTGKFSLTRELGLKINRIAIDPGHGGYDIGTTSPHGLLEKNLCLDVALRLGQLIEQNIPNAEVIYTRKDDRHVPLEERTAIANDANADLFISIHANSSDSRSTRGVETYYVSLATSQESRDLATRENSLAESSLHNLPNLLKKITRNEKLTESKQLALDLQNALSQRLQLVSRQETNRGVKQAPFIVLIGANMPAVLSEISFVSNTSDESLLLESAQRQQVAEGLFRGVVTYLDSMQTPLRPKQKLVSDNHPVAAGLLHVGSESKR